MENMLYIGISILQMVVYAVYLKEILGFKFKGKFDTLDSDRSCEQSYFYNRWE